MFESDQREAYTAELNEGLLFFIKGKCSERKESVQGARSMRGLRTLDRFLPFWKMEPEEKEAGVSGGLPPGGV